jgi:prophage regulatory protein
MTAIRKSNPKNVPELQTIRQTEPRTTTNTEPEALREILPQIGWEAYPEVDWQTQREIGGKACPEAATEINAPLCPPTACIPLVITMLRETVVRKRRGRSRSSHHEDIKAGLFVKPVLIGSRATATPDYEVNILIAARIAGKNDEEIRTLVRKLHEMRKAFV